MSEKALWYLENIDVMGIFCPKKLSNSDDSHAKETFTKGAYVYVPEDASNKIYFITEGRIKIGSRGSKDKEITKAILGKGEVFGELAILDGAERRDYAIAMEDSKVCAITKEEMKNLMKDYSQLNLFLMKLMGKRAIEMEKRLESLVFKDSRSRIIEFLSDLVEQKGQRVGYEMLVRKFVTHQEIANITATSRQTVTTVLNELRNKNILTFDRKRLLIRNMEELNKEMSIH